MSHARDSSGTATRSPPARSRALAVHDAQAGQRHGHRVLDAHRLARAAELHPRAVVGRAPRPAHGRRHAAVVRQTAPARVLRLRLRRQSVSVRTCLTAGNRSRNVCARSWIRVPPKRLLFSERVRASEASWSSRKPPSRLRTCGPGGAPFASCASSSGLHAPAVCGAQPSRALPGGALRPPRALRRAGPAVVGTAAESLLRRAAESA